MSGKRGAGFTPAIGWTLPGLLLVTGLSTAHADELADLRANQELLQRRVDQLAQAGPATGPGPGGPVLSGSFPRSFAVPGSEVSLRIGGQGVGSVVWYMKGSAVGGGLGGQGGFNETYVDGQGGTGNLPSIPLNNHTFSNTASGAGFAHSRSSEWDFSGKQTRFFLDARTPSPYGEVKAYIEMDFSASNTNTILNNNAGVTNGYIPRFRQGYAALGGLLMGQTQGTFVDNDADPELLDFGGTQGSTGRSRAPQIRYTYPLPYGMSIAVAAENPDADFSGPFGGFQTDTNGIPTASNCAALTQAAALAAGGGTTASATNITNLCSGSAAFFNAGQNLAPDFVHALSLRPSSNQQAKDLEPVLLTQSAELLHIILHSDLSSIIEMNQTQARLEWAAMTLSFTINLSAGTHSVYDLYAMPEKSRNSLIPTPTHQRKLTYPREP